MSSPKHHSDLKESGIDPESVAHIQHIDLPSPSEPVRNRTWYRTTFFNVSIVALCAFLAPGLWAAQNALGAGGAAEPAYVNAANSVTFTLMVVICVFGSAIISRIGLSWALALGGVGFPVYAASLYCHVKYQNNWFIMVACVLLGLCAGLFWLTEGAIVLSYPEKKNRGTYIAYWLSFRVVGQLIGGAVSLAVNSSRSERGAVSINTYLIFIAFQALTPFVAKLLSPPGKVQRTDGTAVKVELPREIKTELKAMFRLVCRKEILLLTPMMFQSVFSEAFFSTYNASYFTVRARALAALMSGAIVIITNFMLGAFLDYRKLTVHTRAVAAFFFIYTLEAGIYIYSVVMCKDFESRDAAPTFDWEDAGFGSAVAAYVLLVVGFNLMYDYLYWLVGCVNKNGAEIIRLSALIRGVESAGQAIAYGINSIEHSQFAMSSSGIVNISFFAACIIPSWLVIWKVGIVGGVKVHDIIQDEDPMDSTIHESVNQGETGKTPTVSS